jgi:hypothetical protein
MIARLFLFVKPWFKKLSLQPTLNNKPFGKPFKFRVIKLGFKFYMIITKPRLYISKIGSISIPPTYK